MPRKKGSRGSKGNLVPGIIRKNVQIRPEHYEILQRIANDRFEGNLSMLIRHIMDWYIENQTT